MSAADRIDKFYTFNKKNEEFQQLLNREYEKVKSGNAIKTRCPSAKSWLSRNSKPGPKIRRGSVPGKGGDRKALSA